MKYKKLKSLATLDGDDLISNLPDDILCHILSFLPTKFAFLTSVLSKRWMHTFGSVIDIDLVDNLLLRTRCLSVRSLEESRPGIANRFNTFASNVLLARNSTSINRFHLLCFMKSDYLTVSGWVSNVILLNVRDLDISVELEEPCIVPHEIFTCRSLEYLKLRFGSDCLLSVPDSVNLPNLRVLHLLLFDFVGEDSTERLFSGCRALEELQLFGCHLKDLETFEISIPSLKYLDLSKCYSSYDESCILLDTPNLQHLQCYFSDPLVVWTKNTKSLVSAHIICSFNKQVEETEDDRYMLGESISRLLNENNHLKYLSLTFSALTALYCCSYLLAKFRNLTYMELNTTDRHGCLMLPELLHSSPNLEVLCFPEGFICVRDIESIEGLEYRVPESVPLCFSRSLREIKIGDFNGWDCEFELVEYFLKNGELLRKMMIGSEVYPMLRCDFRGNCKNLRKCPDWIMPTFKRLSEATRTSKTCRILISWEECPGEKLRELIL